MRTPLVPLVAFSLSCLASVSATALGGELIFETQVAKERTLPRVDQKACLEAAWWDYQEEVSRLVEVCGLQYGGAAQYREGPRWRHEARPGGSWCRVWETFSCYR